MKTCGLLPGLRGVIAFFAMAIALHPSFSFGQSTTDGYTIAPAPTWVVNVDLPTSLGEDLMHGQRHVLLDRQAWHTGPTSAIYTRHVTDVVGQSGLSDNANRSISFDPIYQHLELHRADVIRDGVTLPRLARARIDVARTEQDSDRALLNGDLTALIVLPDIRVGDRVDLRYTVHGRNPVFGETYHGSWRVRYGVPIERSSLRISVPESVTLRHSPRPEASFVEGRSAGMRSLRWQWDAQSASNAEDDTPRWLPDPDRLDVSAYRDWEHVASWGDALFKDHEADSDAFKLLSDALRNRAERDGLPAAIAAAIDHVQQRIRYYGVELGENSHRPHAPDEVLRNGYGDCKDKALLLVALLDELGVSSWPLLVSARTHEAIIERLPGPGAFDHVVVLIEHDGEQYWVDATDNRQSGSLGRRGQPEYGAGLVLGKPGVALIERPKQAPAQPSSATHDRFYVSSIGGPVDLVTTTTYRARGANWMRGHLDRNGRHGAQERSENFYRGLYGELRTLKPLQIEEDDAQNRIVVTERYRLYDFWDIGQRNGTASFDAYATAVRNRLRDTDTAGQRRSSPFAINGPLRVAHRIQFFPDLSSDERALESRDFQLAGLRYRDTEFVLGDSLVFDSELVVGDDHIDAERLDDYRDFRDRVLRNAQAGRYYRDADRNDLAIGAATAMVLDALETLQ